MGILRQALASALWKKGRPQEEPAAWAGRVYRFERTGVNWQGFRGIYDDFGFVQKCVYTVAFLRRLHWPPMSNWRGLGSDQVQAYSPISDAE